MVLVRVVRLEKILMRSSSKRLGSLRVRKISFGDQPDQVAIFLFVFVLGGLLVRSCEKCLVSLWERRAYFLRLRPPIGSAGLELLEGISLHERRGQAAQGSGFGFLEGVIVVVLGDEKGE